MSAEIIIPSADFQQENERLLSLVSQQKTTITQYEHTIEMLRHQLDLFRLAQFGKKTEKCQIKSKLMQLRSF